MIVSATYIKISSLVLSTYTYIYIKIINNIFIKMLSNNNSKSTIKKKKISTVIKFCTTFMV